MSVVQFPECRGPRDLPAIRSWLCKLYRDDSRYSDAMVRGGLSTDSRFIRETLNTAKLWWVTKETCDLLAVSAPTVPDDVVFDWNDAPIPSGFAVFDEDLTGIDSFGPQPVDVNGPEYLQRTVRVSAIMWGPVALPPLDGTRNGRIGLGIGMWTRADLSNGLDGKMMAVHAPTIAALTEYMQADAPLTPEAHVMHGNLFTYIGRTDWLDGRLITEVTPGAPSIMNPAAAQSMTEDRKLITALWTLTRTPYVSLVREHVDRATARRSTRHGHDPEVRVLTLHGPDARQSVATGEGGTRDWKHSWIVSPHYRWQPVGPGRTQRRLILIASYRKGDPTKPLLGGERVWRVVAPHGAPAVTQ